MKHHFQRILRHRIKPITALIAIRRLLQNPDDTSQVFKIIQALSGNNIRYPVDRLRREPGGAEMLAIKPDIVAVLNDRERLAQMPAGSIGRAYYNFVHRENLSADGLVESSKDSRAKEWFTAEERWTADRLRDIHDLQHVLTGYGRDPVGELSLLAFMTTQVPNRGIDFIIFMAKRKYQREMPKLDIAALIDEGRRLGKSAAWMLAVPWEDRLHEPLDEVRASLGFTPVSAYQAAADTWTDLAQAA